MHLIETRSLCHAYSTSTEDVLKNIHFVADERQRIAVLGPNGAGKSTLFRHFNGILFPKSGEVLIRGEPITKANLSEVRRFVGLVFQNPDDQVFSPTVEQDIAFGPYNLGLDADCVAERVDRVCEMLGLEGLRSRAPHHLSGGEKKRVAIAGVLAMEPQVMVLDEPTAGLDPQGVKELFGFLNDLPNSCGVTVIYSTHQVELVPEMADLVYVMERGEITGAGTPEEIFLQEDLLARAHLELPALPRLIRSLQKHGVAIDPAYTYHDAEQSFLKAFGKL
ncbi:ATP-binding cassette domain-containing protein [Methanocorpusculum vombati]|uniref:ABC transporter ATP-binding protein n=1 Tax=Methanocorpusculum vombati TaxID=3002864 RepID=A0ABT4IME4_9EURY|nr:ATP-binding cassette domain-containing protein [Methanocorpusculum vombati]MCZ9319649.1 ATP-binding cassette domain-containing protein [Methanocorpusculum sp.]MCZ0862916.1 ATP-binding cassette domain-containing protein [Methanocorpusculum vombati]MDE2520893.1 ATP-binding cassette domain-containing protein [Methanocorpusculum sp.]MDE2533664.1 ATP-binding cassette domain-containing protein [Methanocorpusculum sp.]MDE2546893.1 ATP-binding cassette domain-containing protein [Methanocorpusculum 